MASPLPRKSAPLVCTLRNVVLPAVALFGGAPGDDGSGASVPEASRVSVAEPAAAPGYVLFAPLSATTIFLLDGDGKPVHTWRNPASLLSTKSVYLLDDGTILRAAMLPENPAFNRGGRTGAIQRLDDDANIVWEYRLSDERRCLHHDIEPLPNGNVLAIAWERISFDEAVALGRDPEDTHPEGWWPDTVIEIRPTLPSGGEIVWEWRARDHLVQDRDPRKPGHGSPAELPGRIDVNALGRRAQKQSAEALDAAFEQRGEMAALGYGAEMDEEEEEDDEPAGSRSQHPKDDWLHLNSVDYDAASDLILLSSPELNEIFVLDHSTTTAEARGSKGGRYGKGGDLLWRWGNPRNYGHGTAEDQQLFFQHQAEWVPAGWPGAGHVTLFNNGLGRPGAPYSSIEELALPFDPAAGFLREPKRAFGPARPAWSYRDPAAKRFYSMIISGCHRLPNGNTFVCSGQQGRLFEVTPEGRLVWEFWNDVGGELENVFTTGRINLAKKTAVFRATKIPPDHPGLKALDL